MKKLLLLLCSLVCFIIPENSLFAQPNFTPNLAFCGVDFSGPKPQIAFVALEDIPSSRRYLITDLGYSSKNGRFETPNQGVVGDILFEFRTVAEGLTRGQVVVITIDNDHPDGYTLKGGDGEVDNYFTFLSDWEFTSDETLYLIGNTSFAPWKYPTGIVHSAINLSNNIIPEGANPANSNLPQHKGAIVIDLDPDDPEVIAADFKESERGLDFTVADLLDQNNWIFSNTGLDLSAAPFFAPTPVELVDFSAKMTGNSVELTWITAAEINNEGFEVQKSQDGIDWQAIAFVEGAGNTIQSQTYTFLDREIWSGTSLYRLKQIDFDGQFEYSNVVSVNSETGTSQFSVQLYPNPTTHFITIETSLGYQPVFLSIYNSNGQLIANQQVIDQSVDVSLLPQGTYLAKIQMPNNETILKFVKR